jgi:hypothetical protein
VREFHFPQKSPEWWDMRKDRPTASNFDRVMTPKQGKTGGPGSESYLSELSAAVLRFDPGMMTESFETPAMRQGADWEPEARRWYQYMHLGGSPPVRQVGLCVTDCWRFACSPDGLVGDDGGLELKCPQPATHASYLRKGGLPVEYKCQVHGCLVVTGRDWWDFVSYCPPFDPLVVRVVPDEFTGKLAAALDEFHDRLLAAVAKVTGRPTTGRCVHCGNWATGRLNKEWPVCESGARNCFRVMLEAMDRAKTVQGV